MLEKQCTRCGVTKPVQEFHKRKDAKDGLKSWCKGCRSKEEAPRYQVKRDEYNKQWRARTVEQRRARQRTYYRANKEEILAKGKKWREVNSTYFQDYYQTHREEYIRRARARELTVKSSGSLSPGCWGAILQVFNGRCYYCGSSERIEQEHMKPISRGGRHEATNVVPACLPCNRRKGTKTAEEFFVLMAEVGPGA